MKVTVMVQDVPAAKLEPQVLVRWNTPGPCNVTPVMLSVVLPTLVSVVDLDALWGGGTTKAKLAGLSSTSVPTPMSEMVCWLPGALSVIERLAARPLMPVGVKVTLMVQLPPGPTVPPQVLV